MWQARALSRRIGSVCAELSTRQPIVSFRFSASGTRRFAKITRENIGRPFAIVLDNEVLSAPVIREPILGGSGQISGSFTLEDARPDTS
jgi:preprotein translocase subunit SecD